MFSPASRYASIPTNTLLQSNGRTVTYVRRRFLPQGKTLPPLADIIVQDGDRLDSVAAAALGDPEQFWRMGDANDAMNPQVLVAEPGRRLRVPLPQA